MLPGEAPTPQPIPGGVNYDIHGKPSASEPITVQKVIYVDAAGLRFNATVISARKAPAGPPVAWDISVEIGFPLQTMRRDGVMLKQDDSQAGDYLVFPDPAPAAVAEPVSDSAVEQPAAPAP
jgi:hypothetical protein